MPIAAVPKYLGSDFKGASPGMRFGMYLKLWGQNRRTQALLWTTYDVGYEVRGQQRQEREVHYENKTAALSQAKTLTKVDKDTVHALLARQSLLGHTGPQTSLLRIEAQATAPFTTGLGNDHPLENGFSFLWPYGLPYLPGSGVKGVIRKAAQELAAGMWGDSRGWSAQPAYVINVGTERKPRTLSLSVIDVLFGREPPKGDGDHVRGALEFWDVIPEIAGDSLLVEIMTPHQTHYYQQKSERKSGDSVSPHDSGQPNPIAFLTIPPGSTFAFHVVCDERHLARLIRERQGGPDLLQKGSDGKPLWQKLIEAAFEHAFQWLGFGAKTAVGYGAMRLADEPGAKASGTGAGEERAQSPRRAGTEQADEQTWPSATLVWKPGPQELTASFQGKVTKPLRGEQAKRLIEALGARAGKLTREKALSNVAVKVRKADAGLELVGLA